MANLKSRDVLQVNATIIAGILILLTISSLSTNPLVAKFIEFDDEIFSKQLELDGYKHTLIQLENKLGKTTNVFDKQHIQKQIEDTQYNITLLEGQISKLADRMTEWQNSEITKTAIETVNNSRNIIIVLITPFALSAVFEILYSLSKDTKNYWRRRKLTRKKTNTFADIFTSENENTDDANDVSKIMLIIGFIILIIGVSYLLSQPLF
ncbi:hypothetical protein [Nitrosopumilus sp.]|uniref:hypothetical protein n=1 Tax=Nitrosopumilus sp. TaxID=2024843 RepID=UPI003D12FCC1